MLKELITGGEKVQEARNKINRLEARSRLSTSQQKELDKAHRITRRHALSLFFVKAPVALGSAAIAVKYSTDFVSDRLDTESTVEWDSKSPLERIKSLQETGLKHSIHGNKEVALNRLATAVSEYYCGQVNCHMSPGDLASKVQLLDQVSFTREAINYGRITPEEKDLANRLLETQPPGTNTILMNTSVIDNHIAETIANNPGFDRYLRSKIDTKYYESVLFHALTHVNAGQETIDVTPITFGSERVTFDKIQGFKLLGKGKDGNIYTINGANEAATEVVSTYVSKGTGPQISQPRYGEGANLIFELNRKVGITSEEFANAYFNNGAAEILRKWGSIKNQANPDSSAALYALAAIGLFVQGSIKDSSEARKIIGNYLNP